MDDKSEGFYLKLGDISSELNKSKLNKSIAMRDPEVWRMERETGPVFGFWIRKDF